MESCAEDPAVGQTRRTRIVTMVTTATVLPLVLALPHLAGATVSMRSHSLDRATLNQLSHVHAQQATVHHGDGHRSLNMDGGWTIVPDADDTEGVACGSGGAACHLNSTVATADACREICENVPNCNIFSWNQHSHHCYTNVGGLWAPLDNDHVISGCRPASVPKCPATPPPAPPSPPPPAPPAPPQPQPLLPTMIPIPAGTYMMGYKDGPLPPGASLPNFPMGDADESPAHMVHVSAFAMSATEVTNRQYEQFDPSHKGLRGKLGFSTGDDEAVVFVSWNDAVNYTRWLSDTTGHAYSLPTEAEWEFAARGNNTATNGSAFWTGDAIPPTMLNNPKDTGIPTSGLPLTVARFASNGFGLFDTLGNVEEWVHDWHGPYTNEAQQDPVGPSSGTFRATRGGSHSTEPYYLRSANRAGALPEERSWYIGFRVVLNGTASKVKTASGQPFNTLPQSDYPATRTDQTGQPHSDHAHRTTSHSTTNTTESWPTWNPIPMVPVVRRYVNWPGNGSALPFSLHNHEPTIVACPDGSVYANWYSTNCGEPGRCTGLVDARLAPGAKEWTTARVQLDAPDRCQCCTALYLDRTSGVLYHFSGMSAAGTYEDIIGTLQSSTDCGATWTAPKIIWPDHGIEHQIVVTIIASLDGTNMLIPCDHWGTPPYTLEGDQSIVQHAPMDRLADPSAWTRAATPGAFYNNTGSHHTSIVALRNGSYLAVGRAHDIDGTMPMAYSNDGGHVWFAHASPFTGIHGGQREVMIRLGSPNQPLMHCTYANGPPAYQPTYVNDSAGGRFTITGLYCAVSYDDGETWPNRRTITDTFSHDGRQWPGFDGKNFTMSYNSGEPNGYMAATVSDDGKIHLITSRNSYSFNLAWLAAKPDPPSKRL
eukprot:m.104777 g.104777  ORF g.104777 m.104777 type:complete len:879 (-) comp10537_c0_seq2:67-2703(-)